MEQDIIVKDAGKLEHFTAGDLCSLAEVLHPRNEKLPFSDYSLSHAEILPRGHTVPHRLKTSSEVYWIIEGTGTLFINGNPVALKKGKAVLVAPSAEQYAVNDGDGTLEFLCIVSPPWNKSDEEII
ncbi:MAG: cupin domain-containing protein [Synergistaceae bacterium]|nr:cupin domain-containing protein [Synergistaceae bacterium]